MPKGLRGIQSDVCLSDGVCTDDQDIFNLQSYHECNDSMDSTNITDIVLTVLFPLMSSEINFPLLIHDRGDEEVNFSQAF